MATKRIDARGLSCPQPVILVSRSIEEGNTELEILVDSEVSKENVLRVVTRKGLKAEVKQEGPDSVIRTTKA
jgi:tRNA 2-thiouridine synthesizing protein A